MKLLVTSLIGMLLLPAVSRAADTPWYEYDHLYLQGGSYVHFESSDDHAGSKFFASLEAVRSDAWLYGLALFDNSFGQFSQYLYGGKSWNFSGKFEHFHFKLTAGLIHGYKDEYQDKIPMNNYGIAPAVIPGIGYKRDRWGADMILLGNSAMLFTIGYDL